MASIVITLPTGLVFVVAVPNGGQVVPVAVRECACGCKEWFVPAESTQLYFSSSHQQHRANERRPRKTERRQMR